MKPQISVIIATYKRPHLICRALDSVKTQSLQPMEIFVVDDASGDTTEDVVAAWSKANATRIKFIAAPHNRGVGAARNLAMRQAAGEFIAFLDSDDAYLPGALETLYSPLAEHLDAVLSFADAQQHWPDARAPIPMMRRCLTPATHTSALNPEHPEWRVLTDPQSVLLTTSMIPTCSALFRRSAAQAVGYMPEYRHGEDWIFWLKLVQKGDFICQFVDTANVYRQDDNLTGPTYDAVNSRQSLNALLRLRDGSFGINIAPQNLHRLNDAITEKAWHMRYCHSLRGITAYLRVLGEHEAQETGGRMLHLIRDPKSIARALFASF